MARALVSIVALGALLSSCGTPAATSVTPTPSASATPYLRTELIDVRTNERFTLASLAGKVVIVEGMAVW